MNAAWQLVALLCCIQLGSGCQDRQITLAGLSCRAWLSQNLPACNHQTIITNCCASRAQLCGGGSAGGINTQNHNHNMGRPTAPSTGIGGNIGGNVGGQAGAGGCTDTPGVTLGGQSCAQYLSSPAGQAACGWSLVTQHCCASRAQYCGGAGAGTGGHNHNQIRPTIPSSGNVGGNIGGNVGSGGCTDTPGVTLGGQSCAQYLSSPAGQAACSWSLVTQHCCASRAQYCGGAGAGTGGHNHNHNQIRPTIPSSGNIGGNVGGNVGAGGCTDTPGVTIGGQSCAQYLSSPNGSAACGWSLVTQHCCASRARYCGGTGAGGPGGVIG